MTKKEARKRCEIIAMSHNVEVTWIKGANYGYYIPNTNKIAVGTGVPTWRMLNIFCHEMGHVFNFRTKKYYKYHRYVGKEYTKRFKTKHRVVDYALKAEMFTDRVGRKLCREWFPGTRFKTTYKYNDAYYNYLYSKYFPQYFIVLFLV